jgi:hypothetical protein
MKKGAHCPPPISPPQALILEFDDICLITSHNKALAIWILFLCTFDQNFKYRLEFVIRNNCASLNGAEEIMLLSGFAFHKQKKTFFRINRRLGMVAQGFESNKGQTEQEDYWDDEFFHGVKLNFSKYRKK